MARTRVYSANANLSTDNPSFFLPRKHADDLVSNRRAIRLSAIAIQLLAVAVSREIIAAAGYDGAVHRDPQKHFCDAWQKCSSGGAQMLQMYPFRQREIDRRERERHR